MFEVVWHDSLIHKKELLFYIGDKNENENDKRTNETNTDRTSQRGDDTERTTDKGSGGNSLSNVSDVEHTPVGDVPRVEVSNGTEQVGGRKTADRNEQDIPEPVSNGLVSKPANDDVEPDKTSESFKNTDLRKVERTDLTKGERKKVKDQALAMFLYITTIFKMFEVIWHDCLIYKKRIIILYRRKKQKNLTDQFSFYKLQIKDCKCLLVSNIGKWYSL